MRSYCAYLAERLLLKDGLDVLTGSDTQHRSAIRDAMFMVKWLVREIRVIRSKTPCIGPLQRT